MFKSNISLGYILTVLKLPKCADSLVYSKNITKDYPIAKPLKYVTTRSHHPLTQKGEPTFSVLEQASYCLVFGCSCMVFLPDGLSTSARQTIFDRTAPRNRRVTWSSRPNAGQSVRIYHMWEVRRPSDTSQPLNKHIKMPLWEDKMSSWL